MKDFFLIITILLLAGVLVFSLAGPNVNIAEAISQDDDFEVVDVADDIRVYKSPQKMKETISDIEELKKPYDKNMGEKNKKSVLLYEKEVVVVYPENNETKVEVLEHDRAYNRHHTFIHIHWGGMRNGSIGTPSTRGGGFGFGK